MKAVISVLGFATRHLLFVVFAMLAGWVLWTVAYVVLLLVAVIANQGLGGPLAYPAGLIAVAGSCVFLGWGIFTPASALGSIFCRLFKLPLLSAIPVVFVSAFLISYLFYWGFVELLTTGSMPSALEFLKNFTIFLSVPLGAYWWLTEGPGALFDGFHRWFRNRFSLKLLGD
jgi:hypothetical protein